MEWVIMGRIETFSINLINLELVTILSRISGKQVLITHPLTIHMQQASFRQRFSDCIIVGGFLNND